MTTDLEGILRMCSNIEECEIQSIMKEATGLTLKREELKDNSINIIYTVFNKFGEKLCILEYDSKLKQTNLLFLRLL